MLPVTVLIADPQEAFRIGLSSILRTEKDITVVGEACDGTETIDRALKLKPRVILMDLSLALHQEGDAISRVRAALPLSVIVIIADSQEERDVFEVLSLGAQGYLLKSSSHMEIARVVRRVADGEVILSPSIAANLVKDTLNWKKKAKITEKEAEVLDLVGKGLTNREIASRLSVSENTIKTYIWRLREKLNLRTRLDLGIYTSRRKLNTSVAELTSAPSVESPIPMSEASVPIYDQEQSSDAPAVKTGEFKPVTVLCLRLNYQSDPAVRIETDKIQEILGENLDLTVEQIHHYDGIVTWFNENGFIALFGVPITQEHAPQKALSAALSILDTIKHHSDQMRPSGINIDAHIGINTGSVLIGESSINGLARRYIPVGDTTSLAIKAQAAAPCGTIVATENTHSLTMHQFVFLPLNELAVQGIGEPIKMYSVLGYPSNKSKIEVSAALGLTRFVGRQRELETLKHAFDEAKLGSLQVVGVAGEAGVGKSRLLLKFREELPPDEFTYVEGSCIHYGDSIPYLPLLQALRYYFDIAEGEAEATSRKKMDEKIRGLDNKDLSLIPPLRDILSLKVEDEEYLKLEPVKKKERIFDAVRDLIRMASLSRTVLILLEDCHWADKPSEELLYYLIDSLGNARVVFVLLYRPEWQHQLSSRSNYSQIGLKELPPNASTELIGFILGDGEADPELQQFVMHRAGGNPLFMEELLHNLRESGHIYKKQKYMLSAKPSEIKIPTSLHSIIAARIDQLNPDNKHILQIAAVIGRYFSYRILHNLVEVKRTLKPCLLSLQRNDFIYERGLTAEPYYMFKHVLTQEVIYQSLRTKTRKELHGRVGRVVEEQYTQGLEEFYEVLAHHYSKSDNYEKAYKYLKLSAEKALRKTSSLSASFQYCKEAIDILGKLPQTEENKRKGIEIRLAMVSSIQGLACPEDSLQILHEGEILCEGLHDDRSLAQIYSVTSFCHAVKGNGAERVRYAQEAFDSADRVGDLDLMAPIGGDLSSIYNIGGESSKAVAVASKVVRLLENTHRESEFFGRGYNLYSYILASHGRAVATLGNFSEGKILCARALRFAEDVGLPFNMGWAQLMLGWVYVARGDGQNVVRHAQKAVEYLEASQMRFLAGVACSALGLGYYFLGNIEMGRKNAESAIEIQKSTGSSFYVSLAHLLLGMTNFQTGDSRNARICIEQGLRLAQENNEKWIKGLSMIWLGRCMDHSDVSQQEAAEISILQGIGILDELQSRPYASIGYLILGELHTYTGHKEKALQHLKKAESSFSEMGMEYWLPRAQQALSMVET